MTVDDGRPATSRRLNLTALAVAIVALLVWRACTEAAPPTEPEIEGPPAQGTSVTKDHGATGSKAPAEQN